MKTVPIGQWFVLFDAVRNARFQAIKNPAKAGFFIEPGHSKQLIQPL